MNPVAQRVHTVLDLFGQLSAAQKDGGYCGPRGRVITATEVAVGYTLTAILRKQAPIEPLARSGVGYDAPYGGYHYIVEFQLHTVPGASPLHLMAGALKMATLHDQVPTFTENECGLVDECLNDIFGPPSKL
jgi:hypothetical protein